MVYLGFAEEDDERYDDLDTSEDRYDLEEDRGAAVTPLRRTPVAHVVREPAATLNRITTIHPRTYNEAKTIGEAFRDGVPVIMNLTDMEACMARSSG
jgi:cell division inhibitor SepF